MNETGRLSLRLALVVALAATLGLTACVRRGPLDAPPASAASAGAGGAAGEASDAASAGDTDADETPKPRARNKRIPLDVLLN